jgi:TPR repeat protein
MLAKGEGVPQNLPEARKYFEMAAENLPMFQYNYAVMLAKGEGVPQNLSEARKYLEMAAQQGLEAAIRALSILKSSV